MGIEKIIDLPESIKIVSQQMENTHGFSSTLSEVNFTSFNAIKNLSQQIALSVQPISNYFTELHKITSIAMGAFTSGISVFNIYLSNAIRDTLFMQYDTLAISSIFTISKDITELRKGLYLNNFDALYEFTKSFHKTIFDSQNLAILKLSNKLKDAISGDLYPGIASIVNDMHVGTARGLAKSCGIEFSMADRVFFDSMDTNNNANIKETNIIYSGLEILNEITDKELFEFFNFIRKFSLLAANHPVGQKIRSVIRELKTLIDFDMDYYYHARSRAIDSCPYSDIEMLKAPNGLTMHGRFNMPGESHYYFSNQRIGALIESRRHCSSPDIIQIAKIKPKNKIRLFDLSMESIGNKFLEYCRFPINPNTIDNLRREYLIPSYIATCCREAKIDGIKYYGSKEYYNYVTWYDHYFNFISQELEAK